MGPFQPFYGSHFSGFDPRMHRMYRRGRGPTRLIWFVLGGAATYAWMSHKSPELSLGAGTHCMGRTWRPPVEDGTPENSVERSRMDDRWRAWAAERERMWRRSPVEPRPGEYQQSRSAEGEQVKDMGAGAAARVYGEDRAREVAQAWDAERERVKELGRYAGETVSGMSEATIDSMLAALQNLKSRLADRRDQQASSPPPPPPTPKVEEPPRRWV
ncbi:hypothetical protein BV25DRAFT_1829504 [Artomyces pyxidatus]|uniref:Uncharacterized protein n=1 Tax=Artomyces pyxidatus TaxID=48021 RepID=A0ACB8SRX9_9AGAM|nr:hypothetical protein BV25DRAFT_1829504 [Artomyces pyxidatus]